MAHFNTMGYGDADSVKEASAEVMKGRKISKPKGKNSARPTMTSAIAASMNSTADPTQPTGLHSPTVPPSAPSTLPATSNTSEPRDLSATPSLTKPATPARSSRLASLMKEQQHGPSKLGSLLDEIAQPTVTTYTPYGPSTRIGSLRDEINQPTVAKYAPHPFTSQFPPMQQEQPSKNVTRPDEINQPTAEAYSSHPSTSQFSPKQQEQCSTIGSVPNETSQPPVTTYTPHPPTSQSHPKQVDSTSSELLVSSDSIIPQDVIPVLPPTAGVRHNAPLVVPQPSQLPMSQVITPPYPLAASVNSNIPLFHPSMLPNPNKHFTAAQNPTSPDSYGYSSQISTQRSVTPNSQSTAMRTKQTKEEDLVERDVHSQMKPYPGRSGAFGNPRPEASFSPYTDKTIQPGATSTKTENNRAPPAHASSPLFGQGFQPASSCVPPSARPSMSEILRDSPTNPNWKPATPAFVPSVPHTPWCLQTRMDHDEGEILPAPETLPSISDYLESTSTADSDEMEDLKPAFAAIIPQPMYRPSINYGMVDLRPEVTSAVPESVCRPILNNEMEDLKPEVTPVIPEPMYQPTMNNELDDLGTVSERAQSPSILQYNQNEGVLTYDAEATPHTLPVAASHPMFHIAVGIASTEVATTEEVPAIKNGKPSSSEEAFTTPECSDTVQNIETKQIDLDPRYFKYRNGEVRKPRPFQWDMEDNRDARSEHDCTDEEMKEIIHRLMQLKLRVPECPTTILDNEIRVVEGPATGLENESRVIESATQAPDKESRVIECSTTALDNEAQVIECSATAMGNEIVQSQFCPQRTAPTSSIEDPVLPDSSNGNVPKQDGTIRDLCVVEPTSADDPLLKNFRELENTTTNPQATIEKQCFRIEQLEKEVKEQKEVRIKVWRSTVEEAAAKRTKRLEIATNEKLAELDHKESSLREERKQFETDCVEREEDLKSREQKLASNEREYARRLRHLQTREAQVAESSKQLKRQQEEQKERDDAAASRLKEAQEELETLKGDKKQCEDDANLRFKKVREELESFKKEKERATMLSNSDQIPPVEVSKGSPDNSRIDPADLSTLSSSGSSKTPSMFMNGHEIGLEHIWSMFTDARVFEDPHQSEQNLMFSSTWNCDSDIEYSWPIFIDARVSEDPQQIEQNLMFSNTWNTEEHVADTPRTSTRSHWKWMLPLLLVLILLSSTVPKLLQQPLSSKQDVTIQHLPDTCSFTERPVTVPSLISQADFLCLADYSNNYSEASLFPASDFFDLANDVRPVDERGVDIVRVRVVKTAPTTRTVFKLWVWNFVLTGTAYGRVSVEAGRPELYQ